MSVSVSPEASVQTQMRQLRTLFREQAAAGGSIATVPDPPTRALVDRADFLTVERQDASAARQADLVGLRACGGFTMVSGAAALLSHTFGISPLLTAASVLLGGVLSMGTLIHGVSVVRDAVRLHGIDREAAAVDRKLDEWAGAERAASARRLDVGSMKEAERWSRLASEVERDPQVAIASYQLGKARAELDRKQLVASEQQPFDLAARMQEKRLLSRTLLAVPLAFGSMVPAASVAGLAWSLSHLAPLTVGVGAAVALGTMALASRKLLPALTDRVAQALVKAEVDGELTSDRPRVEALQQRVGAVREEASARLLAHLENVPVRAASVPGIGVGEHTVVVNGIVLDRRT